MKKCLLIIVALGFVSSLWSQDTEREQYLDSVLLAQQSRHTALIRIMDSASAWYRNTKLEIQQEIETAEVEMLKNELSDSLTDINLRYKSEKTHTRGFASRT